MGAELPQGPGWWQASDGKWYPPQSPPTPQAQPVAAKRKSGCLKAFLIVLGILVVLGVITLIALGFLVNRVSDSIDEGSREMKPNEVTFSTTTCDVMANSTSKASGSITNNTNETQAFAVEVVFSVNGTQVDDGSADTSNLAPGETGSWTVIGPKTQSSSGTATCDTKVFANLFDAFLPPSNTVAGSTVPTT